jgi:hypothetical protein
MRHVIHLSATMFTNTPVSIKLPDHPNGTGAIVMVDNHVDMFGIISRMPDEPAPGGTLVRN